jgi:hypothetical protein
MKIVLALLRGGIRYVPLWVAILILIVPGIPELWIRILSAVILGIGLPTLRWWFGMKRDEELLQSVVKLQKETSQPIKSISFSDRTAKIEFFEPPKTSVKRSRKPLTVVKSESKKTREKSMKA